MSKINLGIKNEKIKNINVNFRLKETEEGIEVLIEANPYYGEIIYGMVCKFHLNGEDRIVLSRGNLTKFRGLVGVNSSNQMTIFN